MHRCFVTTFQFEENHMFATFALFFSFMLSLGGFSRGPITTNSSGTVQPRLHQYEGGYGIQSGSPPVAGRQR